MRVLRTVAVAPSPVAVAVDAATGRAFVASRGPLDYGGHPRGRGSVAVLDARAGTLLRTVTAGTDPTAVAVAAQRGRVFVLNQGDNSVSLLDAASGRVLHTVAVGRFPLALTVDAPTGHAFVANYRSHTVSVLDGAGGRVVHTVAVPGRPWAVAVDARRRRAFVLTHVAADGSAGRVEVLEAGTGRLRLSVAVGPLPLAVAVDVRTDRVFVVSSGGAGRTRDPWGVVPGVPQLRRWLPWLPLRSRSSEPGSVSVLDAIRV
jgi:YVTN family beta-propeller protein